MAFIVNNFGPREGTENTIEPSSIITLPRSTWISAEDEVEASRAGLRQHGWRGACQRRYLEGRWLWPPLLVWAVPLVIHLASEKTPRFKVQATGLDSVAATDPWSVASPHLFYAAFPEWAGSCSSDSRGEAEGRGGGGRGPTSAGAALGRSPLNLAPARAPLSPLIQTKPQGWPAPPPWMAFSTPLDSSLPYTRPAYQTLLPT